MNESDITGSNYLSAWETKQGLLRPVIKSFVSTGVNPHRVIISNAWGGGPVGRIGCPFLEFQYLHRIFSMNEYIV